MKYFIMLALLLFGLSFAGVGSFALWDHYREERMCTERVAATVTDIEHEVRSERMSGKNKSRNVSYYRPVLTYTVGGVVYDMKTPISDRSPTAFPVKTKVPIMYDPDKPGDFYLEEHRNSPNTFLIFIAIGVGLLLVSVTCPWWFSRHMRQSP